FSILHPCFTSSALLKDSISLIPKPPSFFEVVILFQLIHGILCMSFCKNHQKCLMFAVISCKSFFGRRKQDIAYASIAEMTTYNITSFPARERNLLYQLSILLTILCLRYSKASFLFPSYPFR